MYKVNGCKINIITDSYFVVIYSCVEDAIAVASGIN